MEGSSSSSTQQPPKTPTKRKTIQSARQLQSATKKALAQSCMTRIERRQFRDRVQVITAMVILRREMGHDVPMEDLPDDIVESMFNLNEM